MVARPGIAPREEREEVVATAREELDVPRQAGPEALWLELANSFTRDIAPIFEAYATPPESVSSPVAGFDAVTWPAVARMLAYGGRSLPVGGDGRLLTIPTRTAIVRCEIVRVDRPSFFDGGTGRHFLEIRCLEDARSLRVPKGEVLSIHHAPDWTREEYGVATTHDQLSVGEVRPLVLRRMLHRLMLVFAGAVETAAK